MPSQGQTFWNLGCLFLKLQIPKTSKEFEEKSEEGRRMMKNADLNELAFTELRLSIDVSNSSEKIAFEILKVARRRIMKTGIQPMIGRSS
jgi:thermostable 8-oxoguanine DNA glycosylase